jgi:hypothetical protein
MVRTPSTNSFTTRLIDFAVWLYDRKSNAKGELLVSIQPYHFSFTYEKTQSLLREGQHEPHLSNWLQSSCSRSVGIFHPWSSVLISIQGLEIGILGIGSTPPMTLGEKAKLIVSS